MNKQLKKGNKRRLEMWKERLTKAENAYRGELDLMDARERAYSGEVDFAELVKNESAKAEDIKHIRNVIGELIEAQVDTTIAQPKITALREEDERLAKLAEDMLRGELDRLPIEQMNDLTQRISPIQGGVLYLVEWDNAKRTHTTVGELKLTALHPKQVIPQDGVNTGIEDMDYIFVKLPQTKEYLRRKYGISFEDDDITEEEPEIRGADGESSADDICTQYLAYYRSDTGAIGLFSWAQDTVICDYEDYQARKERRCTVCGELEPYSNYELETRNEELGDEEMERSHGDKVCPRCGSTEFKRVDSDVEIVTEAFTTADGELVKASPDAPVSVRYYKPDVYPIVLQRNVSAYGKFLGASDVDMIYSQQQTINRVELSIIEKLLTGGTITTLPAKTSIKTDNAVGKYVNLANPADKSLIDVKDLTANITPDANYLAMVYEEMRQMIGITDSFQGRKDATATSAVAKEFAARQSAGRLESKREMKNAAWANLFEVMFKFKLAYTDERRPVRSMSDTGEPQYDVFDRRGFIRRDAAGELYYDDEFLFSVDPSASLASNREARWQETRMNLQTGAFGDPTSLDTLILFWSVMETLHYPGASVIKRVLESHMQAQVQQAEMQAQEQAMMERQAREQSEAERMRADEAAFAEREAEELRRIDDMAREDARAAIFGTPSVQQ